MVRLYFNRWADAPRVWSMDRGTQDTEQTLVGFEIHELTTRNGEDVSILPGDKERPRVWLEVSGVEVIRIRDGVAHLYGGRGSLGEQR